MSVFERVRTGGAFGAAIFLAALVGSGVAFGAEAPRAEPPLTADQVLASLNRSLAWYRQARVAMRSLTTATGSVFTRDDEKTALAVVQRAFDTARAEAAWLAQDGAPTAGVDERHRRLTEARAEVQRSIERQTQELQRLQQRLRTTPARDHPPLQRALVAAANRLALDDVRREMLAKFEQFDGSTTDTRADLTHQIGALEDSVPELRSGGATMEPGAVPASSTSATMAAVHRLVALERTRRVIADLRDTTDQLMRNLENESRTVRAAFEPLTGRLRALAADPTAEGAPLADAEQAFRTLLGRAKLVSAVLPPLREESALVRRYARDLEAWDRALDRDVAEAFERLAIGLVGVVVAVVAILVGAVMWRVATLRYVRDPYRRRLLLIVRRVVVLAGLTLVLVFHFASELTALVAGLGFAAAGIAFALQNVILAIAGYFSMMAPGDGIRVGDRVSLQGPFGYVQGDVLQIGLVRIRLREVAGEPLRPTGRVVVFPNSVVFTGSFFKHPATPTPVSMPRPPEAQSA